MGAGWQRSFLPMAAVSAKSLLKVGGTGGIKYGPPDDDLEDFEQAARQVQKGLWIDPRAVPLWESQKFRRGPKNLTTD